MNQSIRRNRPTGPNHRSLHVALAAILAALVALSFVVAPEASARPARRHADVVYDWPIGDGDVTRPFDDPALPWLAGHRGADLAGSEGAEVRAAGDGVVAFAGSVAGRPVVSIDHDDGLRTTYEPVVPGVVAGQRVAGGEVIGTLEAGHGTGADLHWGARRGRDDYVDPVLLVRPRPVIRLYPLRQ